MKTRNNISYLKGIATIVIVILAMCGCKEFKYDKFNITDKPFVNYTSVELFLGEGAGNRSSIQLISSPVGVKYTWTSFDESVATVTQTGLITAVSEGITTVSVASQNDETKVSVIVRKWIPLEDFILDTYEKTIAWKGRADRFKINTLFVPPNTTESTAIQWSSSNPEVATALANGWVIYHEEGEAMITASIAGIEKSAKIVIEIPKIAYVFKKVTETPSDWTGEYLIVHDASGKAFNSGLPILSLDTQYNTMDVTIVDGKIAADATTDAGKVTIAAVTGGWSIQTAGGYYVGNTGTTNSLSPNTVFSATIHTNTITINAAGNAVISPPSNTARALRFNDGAANQRFCYFGSTANQPVSLYKRVEIEELMNGLYLSNF